MKALPFFAQCTVAVSLCLCMTTSCGSDDEPEPELANPVVKLKSIKDGNTVTIVEYDAQNRITRFWPKDDEATRTLTYSDNSVKSFWIKNTGFGEGEGGSVSIERIYTLVGGRVTSFYGIHKLADTSEQHNVRDIITTGEVTYTGDKLTKWTQTSTYTDNPASAYKSSFTFTWAGKTCSKIVCEGNVTLTKDLTASSVKSRGIDFLATYLDEMAFYAQEEGISNENIDYFNQAYHEDMITIPVLLGLAGTPSEYIPIDNTTHVFESGKEIYFNDTVFTYE